MTLPYGWEAVRAVPARSLAVGDVFIQPGAGTAYREAPDGRVHGIGWEPLDGTAWTVTARKGDTVTVRAADGREITATIPEGARVLRAVDPGKAA